MPLGRSITLFVLAIAGAFVYIGNAIPQIKSEPAEVSTAIGGTPEELVAAGKRIFSSDRAQCLTCHSIGEDPKARCPNQDGLGERAPGRRQGLSAAQYLVESVYNPDAYVVPGYPKSQMKPVHKPPIALSHDEILAALCFLNTLGGKTDAAFVEQAKAAQDPWRKGLLRPEEQAAEARIPILSGDPARGRAQFEKQGCIQCHRVGGEGKEVCPDLTSIGASQSAEYVLESILSPSSVIVKGYRQCIVLWKEEGSQPLRGTPVAWTPDRDHPRMVRIAVFDGGVSSEQDVDLSRAAYVGDTIVLVTEDGEEVLVCGDHVSGDKAAGVVLKVLEGERWVERRIPPERIENVNLPLSPMPASFAQSMNPQEVFDLVAYLMEQKGKR